MSMPRFFLRGLAPETRWNAGRSCCVNLADAECEMRSRFAIHVATDGMEWEAKPVSNKKK